MGKSAIRSFAAKLFTAFEFLSLKLIGYVPLRILRNVIYRFFGMCIGPHTTIYGGAEIRCARKIEIGRGTSIGHYAILDGRSDLRIGNIVNLST
jgi:hypothetical protein